MNNLYLIKLYGVKTIYLKLASLEVWNECLLKDNQYSIAGESRYMDS